MNVAYGRIVFWGIEVPAGLLRNTKLLFKDECAHKHNDNIKKKKYKHCEECGQKRYFIETTPTELYRSLENRLIFAQVENPSSGEIERKYYAVMEWYDGDFKIIPKNLEDFPQRRDEFKLFVENLGIWKLKRFGLFTLQDPQPTTAFHKNSALKKIFYGKPAIFVDKEINLNVKNDVLNKLNAAMESDDDTSNGKTPDENKRKSTVPGIIPPK